MKKATFQLRKALEFEQGPKERKEAEALLAQIEAAAEEKKKKKK